MFYQADHLRTSTSAIEHEGVIDKPTPVILKSQFLLVLCAELVAEIPPCRSAPSHYVAILHRQGVLTVRASGWRAADKILGVDHHIAPLGQKPTTVLMQSDTSSRRDVSDNNHNLKTVTRLLQFEAKACCGAIYSRRQLLANADIAASRVAA